MLCYYVVHNQKEKTMEKTNTIQMTQKEWDNLHPDFRTIIDGFKFRLTMLGLVVVEIKD